MQGQDGVQTGRYRPEGIQIYSKRECYSKTQRINIDGETSVRRLTALGRISRSTETHNRPTLRDKKKGSNFSTEHWAIINLMGSLHADDQGQSLPSFVLLRPRPANGSLILARITQTEALAVAFLCFFLCSGTGAPRCQEISDQISRLDGGCLLSSLAFTIIIVVDASDYRDGREKATTAKSKATENRIHDLPAILPCRKSQTSQRICF